MGVFYSYESQGSVTYDKYSRVNKTYLRKTSGSKQPDRTHLSGRNGKPNTIALQVCTFAGKTELHRTRFGENTKLKIQILWNTIGCLLVKSHGRLETTSSIFLD